MMKWVAQTKRRSRKISACWNIEISNSGYLTLTVLRDTLVLRRLCRSSRTAGVFAADTDTDEETESDQAVDEDLRSRPRRASHENHEDEDDGLGTISDTTL